MPTNRVLRFVRAGAILSAAAALACSDSSTTPTGAMVVIHAFLYAGEPVSDIRLTSDIPLSSTDSIGTPVNDGVVTLIRSGKRYALVSSDDSGFYNYPGSDLVVAPGDTFDIEVKAFGRTATGRTIVPTPPGGVTLSKDSVIKPVIDTTRRFGGGGGGFGGGGGTTFDFTQLTLTAHWPSGKSSLFFVTTQNTDSVNVSTSTGFRFRRFATPPTTADSVIVSALTLQYLGRYRLRVYHVNAEYAALYQSRQQDSRDLNEPATNIRNGLGIFSAFASDTAIFRAVASSQ